MGHAKENEDSIGFCPASDFYGTMAKSLTMLNILSILLA